MCILWIELQIQINKGANSMKKIILSVLFVIFIGIFIGSFIEIQKPTKVETNNSIVFSVNKISNDLKNISNLSSLTL